MKRIILFLLVGILVASIVFRFLQARQSKAVQTVDMIQAVEGYPVEVMTVNPSSFRSSRRYTGTVMGVEETEVFANLGEHITEVLVAEGQKVSQGQVIFRLSEDNPQTGLKSHQLAFDNFEKELNRIKALYDQGAVPKQTLDGVKLQYDLAQEALETAGELLDLTAPISGRVTQITAEVGGYAMPGMPLAKIVANGKSRVKMNIPAADREKISIGQKCEVVAQNVSAPGKISRVALSANPEGRYFEAWVTISEKPAGYAFSPGLSAEVVIHLVDAENVITLPYSSVVRKGDKYAAYVITDQKANYRDLVVGGQNALSILVTSGIELGEVVVVRGTSLLEDEAPVRIIEGG